MLISYWRISSWRIYCKLDDLVSFGKQLWENLLPWALFLSTLLFWWVMLPLDQLSITWLHCDLTLQPVKAGKNQASPFANPGWWNLQVLGLPLEDLQCAKEGLSLSIVVIIVVHILFTPPAYQIAWWIKKKKKKKKRCSTFTLDLLCPGDSDVQLGLGTPGLNGCRWGIHHFIVLWPVLASSSHLCGHCSSSSSVLWGFETMSFAWKACCTVSLSVFLSLQLPSTRC